MYDLNVNVINIILVFCRTTQMKIDREECGFRSTSFVSLFMCVEADYYRQAIYYLFDCLSNLFHPTSFPKSTKYKHTITIIFTCDKQRATHEICVY